MEMPFQGLRSGALMISRGFGFTIAIATVAGFCVWATTPYAACADDDVDQILTGARITFDTSARSSRPAQDISVSVAVNALKDETPAAIGGRMNFTIKPSFTAPEGLDLVVQKGVKKSDVDRLVTKISMAQNDAGPWIFHYTLVLVFGKGDQTSTLVQKRYSVILDQNNPSQVTETLVHFPAKHKSKGEQVVNRDKSKPVRQELEAIYARMEGAIEKNDSGQTEDFQADDFSAVDFQGRKLSTQYMAARARLMQQNIRQPIWTHHMLGTIAANGDEAVVTVRQAYSRMQMVNGKLRKVETSVTQDETWVKTPQGWKRRFVQNEKDMEWYVDGKRVEPGKPYDENAPPYNPNPAR